MVRAVLDTTILASIATAGKISKIREIAELWLLHEAFEVVLSTYIYTELEGVLQKPYFRSRLTQEEIKDYLQTVRENSTFVEIKSRIVGVASHSKDDPIIATAVDGKAMYLVTSDKPLQRVSLIDSGIVIASPGYFLHELEEVRHQELDEAA